MFIYIVRHAIAVDRGSPGIALDAERALTPKGIEKMVRHVTALVKLGVTVDEIWTSPLVRAVQTAELLAEGLSLPDPDASSDARDAPGATGGVPVREVDDLAPGGDPAALCEQIVREGPFTGLALVGHEPDLGELATWLLTGTPFGALRFKKGGVACIEVDTPGSPLRGELRWLLTPRQMARMA